MDYFTLLKTISIHNKYYTWYVNICQRALHRALQKNNNVYVEDHHVVPKSFGIGGATDRKNIVSLTAREHYLAHKLLPRFLNDKIFVKKMNYALWYLSVRNKHHIPNSREYEVAKTALIKNIKERSDSELTRYKKARPGKLNGMHGKTHTAEIKEKLSKLTKERLSGKTYEEVYGEKKARELKKDRSEKLKKYISNNPTARQGKNNANAKKYLLIDPAGIEYVIEGGIVSFCKNHEIGYNGILEVVNKQKTHHKGWTGKYLK